MKCSITAFYRIKKWQEDLTDQSERVPAENSLSLLSLLLFKFLIEIETIFTLYNALQMY